MLQYSCAILLGISSPHIFYSKKTKDPEVYCFKTWSRRVSGFSMPHSALICKAGKCFRPLFYSVTAQRVGKFLFRFIYKANHRCVIGAFPLPVLRWLLAIITLYNYQSDCQGRLRLYGIDILEINLNLSRLLNWKASYHITGVITE